MARVQLIHWNEHEAAERVKDIGRLGYEVVCDPIQGMGSLRDLEKSLPEAIVIDLSRLPSHGRKIAHPPTNPVVPQSQFDAYAGKSLVQKLGIKSDSKVGLVNAPQGFEGLLGNFPEGAELHRKAVSGCDLMIWFARSREGLQQDITRLAALAGQGSLWIAWPKKASGVATDLTQQRVREAGLDAGMVDFKVCSIDKTWSGLLFTRRKN